MKQKILKTIVAGLVPSLLFSCSTSQTVTITGAPNTGIYTLGEHLLTTIPATGEVNLEISDNSCHPLLLSKAEGSQQFVPFALNYEKDTHPLNTVALVGAGTFGFIGVVGIIAGGASAGAGAEDVGIPMLAVGGLSMIPAGCLGGIAGQRSEQAAYKYSYKYLSRQKCNSDIHFTMPDIQYVENRPSSRKNKLTQTADAKISTNKVRPGNDLAKKVQGIYVGSGKLRLDDTDIETMHGIKVVIERLSANEVSVAVIEQDGNSFFEETLTCTVENDKSGGYSLVCTDNDAVSLIINQKGVLTFANDNINIEDTVYSLSITGKRTK